MSNELRLAYKAIQSNPVGVETSTTGVYGYKLIEISKISSVRIHVIDGNKNYSLEIVDGDLLLAFNSTTEVCNKFSKYTSGEYYSIFYTSSNSSISVKTDIIFGTCRNLPLGIASTSGNSFPINPGKNIYVDYSVEGESRTNYKFVNGGYVYGDDGQADTTKKYNVGDAVTLEKQSYIFTAINDAFSRDIEYEQSTGFFNNSPVVTVTAINGVMLNNDPTVHSDVMNIPSGTSSFTLTADFEGTSYNKMTWSISTSNSAFSIATYANNKKRVNINVNTSGSGVITTGVVLNISLVPVANADPITKSITLNIA